MIKKPVKRKEMVLSSVLNTTPAKKNLDHDSNKKSKDISQINSFNQNKKGYYAKSYTKSKN